MDTYGDAGGYGDAGELYGGGGGTSVSPATVATTVTVPTPTVTAASVVTPAVVATVATVPAPSVLVGIAAPATVVSVITVPTPTVIVVAAVTPATVATVVAVPTPTVSSPKTVTPLVIARSFTVPTPAVSGLVVVTPAVVVTTTTVPTPVGYAPTVGEIAGGGNLWLETWTRPGSAVFERLAVNVPGPFNFTKRAASGIGQGDMTVPATWDRLNDVIKRVPGSPASDIRTLNRVFIEQPTTAPPRIAYEWFNDVTGDETREDFTQIQGPGIESIMSDGIVYPWDWDGSDESTSFFADWVWGGKDVVGPVTTSFAPQIFQVYNTGTSGTLEIGVSANGGAYQYATVNWDDSAFEVEQLLEALTNVTAVRVVGFGTEEQPWEIEILSPTAVYTVAIGTVALGGSGVARLSVSQFGNLMPIGWTESRVGSTTTPHGVVTDFRASLGGGSDPALPAGCAAWVVFLGQEWYYPGVEKIVKVLPGGIYQVPPLWLYAEGAPVTLRIVVRDMNEQLLTAGGLPFNSFEEITIPANTLTQTVGIPDIRIPEGVTEVKFRIGHIGEGTPPRVFIACPEMREGLAPTTAGGIFTALFDDATVDHVGDGRVVWENLASVGTTFLDLTFTSVVDTDGMPWDEPELTFTAQRGKTYLQVLTDLNHLGYLWSVTPSVTPGRWDVNLYNPDWVDVDATLLSTPAINVGSGVTAGPIFRSHMTGNVVTIEGSQMQFGRSESAASIASIGRREAYQPDRTLLTPSMATLRAVEEVGSRLLSGLSVSVTVDPVNGPVPLLDYDVDWRVNVQIPPALPKSAHRLTAITVNVAETTQYKLAFSSEAFTGVQGVIEGVRRLLLKFEELERIPMEQRGPDVFPTTITTGGSAPTIVIAASNTSERTKPKADYVCNGTADQGTIQTALVDLGSRGGGRILFCEGLYNVSGPITITDDIRIEGMGRGATTIKMESGSSGDMFEIAGTAVRCEMSNFTMNGNKALVTGPSRGIVSNQASLAQMDLHDLEILDFDGYGIYLHRTAGRTFITNSEISENDVGVWVQGEGWHYVAGNLIRANTSTGLDITGSEAVIVGNRIIQNGGAGILEDGFLATEGLLIVGNQVGDNGLTGINCLATPGGFYVITGNRVWDSGGYGIAVNGSSGHFKIGDNVVYGNGLTGIYCVSGFGGTNEGSVTGNVVHGNGQHGIELYGTEKVLISGNEVTSNSKTTDNTYDGIILIGDVGPGPGGPCDQNFVTTNRVWDVGGGNGQRYGINVLNAACNNNVLSNNFVTGSGRTADYNDAGTATTVALMF